MNPDPLTPLDYERIWDDGRDVGFEDGLTAGRRIRPLEVAALLLVGTVIGSVLTLLWSELVSAAPRPAHLSAIPVVDDGRTGAPLEPAAVGMARRESASDGAPRDGSGTPVFGGLTTAAVPISGIASWYPARGLIAAAGPGLRVGDWRGSSITVHANGRSVTVRLADWCACPGRLIDLSDDAFARLAPLSRGLVRVSIVLPLPALPATDS